MDETRLPSGNSHSQPPSSDTGPAPASPAAPAASPAAVGPADRSRPSRSSVSGGPALFSVGAAVRSSPVASPLAASHDPRWPPRIASSACKGQPHTESVGATEEARQLCGQGALNRTRRGPLGAACDVRAVAAALFRRLSHSPPGSRSRAAHRHHPPRHRHRLRVRQTARAPPHHTTAAPTPLMGSAPRDRRRAPTPAESAPPPSPARGRRPRRRRRRHRRGCRPVTGPGCVPQRQAEAVTEALARRGARRCPRLEAVVGGTGGNGGRPSGPRPCQRGLSISSCLDASAQATLHAAGACRVRAGEFTRARMPPHAPLLARAAAAIAA
jgi:hypothetical protein